MKLCTCFLPGLQEGDEGVWGGRQGAGVTSTSLKFDLFFFLKKIDRVLHLITLCLTSMEAFSRYHYQFLILVFFFPQDTNPIFLFSKSTIEAATPPSPSVNYGSGKQKPRFNTFKIKFRLNKLLYPPPPLPTHTHTHTTHTTNIHHTSIYWKSPISRV